MCLDFPQNIPVHSLIGFNAEGRASTIEGC